MNWPQDVVGVPTAGGTEGGGGFIPPKLLEATEDVTPQRMSQSSRYRSFGAADKEIDRESVLDDERSFAIHKRRRVESTGEDYVRLLPQRSSTIEQRTAGQFLQYQWLCSSGRSITEVHARFDSDALRGIQPSRAVMHYLMRTIATGAGSASRRGDRILDVLNEAHVRSEGDLKAYPFETYQLALDSLCDAGAYVHAARLLRSLTPTFPKLLTPELTLRLADGLQERDLVSLIDRERPASSKAPAAASSMMTLQSGEDTTTSSGGGVEQLEATEWAVRLLFSASSSDEFAVFGERRLLRAVHSIACAELWGLRRGGLEDVMEATPCQSLAVALLNKLFAYFATYSSALLSLSKEALASVFSATLCAAVACVSQPQLDGLSHPHGTQDAPAMVDEESLLTELTQFTTHLCQHVDFHETTLTLSAVSAVVLCMQPLLLRYASGENIPAPSGGTPTSLLAPPPAASRQAVAITLHLLLQYVFPLFVRRGGLGPTATTATTSTTGVADDGGAQDRLASWFLCETPKALPDNHDPSHSHHHHHHHHPRHVLISHDDAEEEEEEDSLLHVTEVVTILRDVMLVVPFLLLQTTSLQDEVFRLLDRAAVRVVYDSMNRADALLTATDMRVSELIAHCITAWASSRAALSFVVSSAARAPSSSSAHGGKDHSPGQHSLFSAVPLEQCMMPDDLHRMQALLALLRQQIITADTKRGSIQALSSLLTRCVTLQLPPVIVLEVADLLLAAARRAVLYRNHGDRSHLPAVASDAVGAVDAAILRAVLHRGGNSAGTNHSKAAAAAHTGGLPLLAAGGKVSAQQQQQQQLLLFVTRYFESILGPKGKDGYVVVLTYDALLQCTETPQSEAALCSMMAKYRSMPQGAIALISIEDCARLRAPGAPPAASRALALLQSQNSSGNTASGWLQVVPLSVLLALLHVEDSQPEKPELHAVPPPMWLLILKFARHQLGVQKTLGIDGGGGSAAAAAGGGVGGGTAAASWDEVLRYGELFQVKPLVRADELLKKMMK